MLFGKNKNRPAAEAWARGGFAKNEDKGRHQIFKQTLSAFVTFHVKAGADTGPGWKCFNNDFPFRHFSLKVTQTVRVKCRCWCLRPWVWLFCAGCWVCSASQFPRASMTSTCWYSLLRECWLLLLQVSLSVQPPPFSSLEDPRLQFCQCSLARESTKTKGMEFCFPDHSVMVLWWTWKWCYPKRHFCCLGVHWWDFRNQLWQLFH